MNGYNFTERVRQVLAMSREEAAALNHEYVGTEHMLLGLIREGQGVAATVLQNLSVDLDAIRALLMKTLVPGRSSGASDLPYTSRAKVVLEKAMGQARQLKHSYVGTEHLLLGLLEEEKGIAAQVLVELGITLDKARQDTLRILGTEVPVLESDAPSRLAATRPNALGRAGGLRPVNDVPQSITVELRFADGTVRRRKCIDRLEAMRFLVQ